MAERVEGADAAGRKSNGDGGSCRRQAEDGNSSDADQAACRRAGAAGAGGDKHRNPDCANCYRPGHFPGGLDLDDFVFQVAFDFKGVLVGLSAAPSSFSVRMAMIHLESLLLS